MPSRPLINLLGLHAEQDDKTPRHSITAKTGSPEPRQAQVGKYNFMKLIRQLLRCILI